MGRMMSHSSAGSRVLPCNNHTGCDVVLFGIHGEDLAQTVMTANAVADEMPAFYLLPVQP